MLLNISANVSKLDYLNNSYISNSGCITQIVSLHKGNKNFGTVTLQFLGTWLLKLVSLGEKQLYISDRKLTARFM